MTLDEAFATWREGVEHTHEHFAPTPGKYVGHVPSQTFRDAEKVLLRYLPDLLRSRCSDSAPGQDVAS